MTDDRISSGPLQPGVDYYVEQGKWVFTAGYHLRRGQCCESGCRHCPYGRAAECDEVADQEAAPPGE